MSTYQSSARTRSLAPAFLGVALLGASSPALAARLSVVGAGTFSSLSNSPATTTVSGASVTFADGSKKLGIGGGALLGFRIGMLTELELGALYLSRKIESTTNATIPAGTTVGGVTLTSAVNSSTTTTTTANAIEVPLLVRVHFARYFSLGLGGYAAFGMGNVKSTDSAGTTTQETYSEAGLKKTDYGLLGSAGIHIPMTVGLAFTLDGRYALGLADVNAGTTVTDPVVKQKYRDIQMLAGFQFRI